MSCCCCFSEAPPDHLGPEDPKYKYYMTYQEKFDVALDEVPTKECCWCWYTVFCLPCSLYQVRAAALEHGGLTVGENYRCCQDYFPCPCIWLFDPCVQSCPQGTLCCETTCCPGWSISASRFMIMDKYQLGMHPVDNQIIRCSNFIQLAACICDTLAICFRQLREAAHIVHCIADLVFVSTAGCMAGQIMHEIKLRDEGPKEATAASASADYEPPVVAEATPIDEQSGLLPGAGKAQQMDRA